MKNTKSALLVLAASLMFAACESEVFVYEPGYLVPLTADQDPSIPAITIKGARLHSEVFGNPADPMLVVIHGGPGSDYRYLLNCTAFADDGYYVVFYDQRGSGLSERFPKASYSVETMTEELDAVIAYYRTSPSQKVFLFGHSWGAMLATAYINENLTAINGVILGEPGGLVWGDILDYVGRTRSFSIASEMLSDIVYSEQFLTNKQKDQHAILDYKFAIQATDERDNPTGNEGKIPLWRMGAVINQSLNEIGEQTKPDWTTHLAGYETKVLFVYSENNEAYGLEHAQKVSSAYPNVELFRVDDAGHDMVTFPVGWNNFYPVALDYLNSLNK